MPQNLQEGDLIHVDEEYLHKVIIEHSTNRLEYGNSVPVYDFRAIEDQLLLQLQGRKKFDTDMSHYRNVRFVGETFSNQSKFSSYILEIRRLGATLPLPQIELSTIMPPAGTSEYHLQVKELLGSLERIMLAFRSLPDKDITIATYCQKYKFTGISPLLTEGSCLKDIDICAIVALY